MYMVHTYITTYSKSLRVLTEWYLNLLTILHTAERFYSIDSENLILYVLKWICYFNTSDLYSAVSL